MPEVSKNRDRSGGLNASPHRKLLLAGVFAAVASISAIYYKKITDVLNVTVNNKEVVVPSPHAPHIPHASPNVASKEPPPLETIPEVDAKKAVEEFRKAVYEKIKNDGSSKSRELINTFLKDPENIVFLIEQARDGDLIAAHLISGLILQKAQNKLLFDETKDKNLAEEEAANKINLTLDESKTMRRITHIKGMVIDFEDTKNWQFLDEAIQTLHDDLNDANTSVIHGDNDLCLALWGVDSKEDFLQKIDQLTKQYRDILNTNEMLNKYYPSLKKRNLDINNKIRAAYGLPAIN